MPDAPVDLRYFTAFAGRGSSMFSVSNGVTPEFKRLADEFPDELRRALRHLAYRIKEEIDATIRLGGPRGEQWSERSLMHIYRRMDMLRKGGTSRYFGLKRRKGAKGVPREGAKDNMMHRWKAPGGTGKLRAQGAMLGRMQKGMRFKQTGDMEFGVGALNPRVAHYLGVAQQERLTQITENMRKAFWAAGVPLAKDKSVIKQPRRDLIDSVYEQMSPYFGDIIETRLRSYIAGASGESAEAFRLPWQ